MSYLKAPIGRSHFRIVSTIAIVALAGIASEAQAEPHKRIGVDGDVTIEVASAYQCDGAAPVRVTAPSAQWFAQEALRLQRLVGVARIALSFDCPALSQIDVTGVHGDQTVYRGRTLAAERWALRAIEIPSRSVKLPTPSQSQITAVPAISLAKLGALGGQWFGTARCGRGRNGVRPAQLDFQAPSGGRYRGELTVTGLRKPLKLPFTAKKATGKYDLTPFIVKGKKVRLTPRRTEVVTSIKRVDPYAGVPRHIAVAMAGRCSLISAARLIKNPGLGGEYKTWNSPAQVCRGLRGWLENAARESAIPAQWLKAYPDLVSTVSFDEGANTALFADSIFKRLFGVSASKVDPDAYRELVVQTAECSVFHQRTDAEFKKDIERFLTGPGGNTTLRGMLIPNVLRVRDYHAGRLTFKPDLATIRQNHGNRARAAAKLAAAKDEVSIAKNIPELNQISRRLLKELSVLSPSALEPLIKAATVRRSELVQRLEQASSAPTQRVLAANGHVFSTKDSFPGHTLLSYAFGHAVFVENSIAQSRKCPQIVPVHVKLSSLLPLKHYENRKYGKQFFFYALRALETICSWRDNSRARVGWKLRANYFFKDKPVGELSLRMQDYDVFVSSPKSSVNGWARSKTEPNYVYDIAFSTMLGGLEDRNGDKIRELTRPDLEQLAKRGDLQAAVALAGRNREVTTESGSANVTLGIDLSSYPKLTDIAPMTAVAKRGSVVAAHLLAYKIALGEGLIRKNRR